MSNSLFPVFFDARMIHHSGIGTHIRGLLEAFSNNSGCPEVKLLGDAELFNQYEYTKKLECIPFSAPIYSTREQILLPKTGPGVFHSPHYNIPLFRKKNLVVTVHDLIHLLFPEMLGSNLKSGYAKYFFSQIRKNAAHILTVSEATKRDMMEHLGISADRITVAHNALGSDYQPVKDEKRVGFIQAIYEFSYRISFGGGD